MIENLTYVSAYFRDDQRSSVLSFWEDPNGANGDLIEVAMTTDENDTNFKHLLEHVTIDEIHENTWRYIQESDQAFKDQVIEIAKERGWLVNMDDGGTSDFHRILIDMLFEPFDEEIHKEKLFFFKIQLFEREFVKNCKDKELKKKVRRAATPLEALRGAIDIFDATQAEASTDAAD